MKAIHLITLFVLLCSLISLSYSQTTYTYSLLTNGTCQTAEFNECYPCQYEPGFTTYYYKLVASEYESYGASGIIYSDSSCNFEYSWTYLYGERCQTYFGNCLFFARKSSASVLNLSLTSTDAVVVSLLGDEDVYTQISANKLTAEGEDLTGVQVHSAGKNFFIERQVSETQYSSNLGVYSFGETYTHSPFTFTVTQSVVNFPNSEIERAISDSNVIGFSPFFSAQVTNDNVYPAYKKYSGQINVLVDSDLDLDGLILSNPFYSAVNMTMFPPFQGNDYGQLVFQLEKSNTPFVTVECYQEEGSLGDIYDCSMGSLSGIFYGSFLSFSLDEFGEKKLAKPDEMSFSLF